MQHHRQTQHHRHKHTLAAGAGAGHAVGKAASVRCRRGVLHPRIAAAAAAAAAACPRASASAAGTAKTSARPCPCPCDHCQCLLSPPQTTMTTTTTRHRCPPPLEWALVVPLTTPGGLVDLTDPRKTAGPPPATGSTHLASPPLEVDPPTAHKYMHTIHHTAITTAQRRVCLRPDSCEVRASCPGRMQKEPRTNSKPAHTELKHTHLTHAGECLLLDVPPLRHLQRPRRQHTIRHNHICGPTVAAGRSGGRRAACAGTRTALARDNGRPQVQAQAADDCCSALAGVDAKNCAYCSWQWRRRHEAARGGRPAEAGRGACRSGAIAVVAGEGLRGGPANSQSRVHGACCVYGLQRSERCAPMSERRQAAVG
jgi:hypothetical protein